MRAWYVVVRIVVMLSTLYTTAGARNQCVANENLLRTIAPTDWAHHEAIHFAPLSLSSEEAMVLKFTNPTLEPVEQSVHLDCQLPDSTAFLPLHPPEEDVSALPFHLAFTVQSMNQEPIPLKGNLVFTAKDNKQFQVSIDTGTPGSDCFTAQIPILMSSVLESLHLTFLPRPEWEVQLSLGLFLDSKIPIKPSVTHTNLLAPLQQADVSSTKLLSQSRALLEAFQWKVNSQIVHQIDWISARSDQNEKASYFLVGPGSFSPKDEYCEILTFETVLKTIPGLHLSNFEFSGTLRTDTTSILEQFLRVCVTVFEQTSNDRKKRASHQICQILSKSMLLSDSPHTLSNKADAIISFPVHLQIPTITTQTRNPDLPQNNIYLHLSVHMMNADARTSISPRVVRVHYTLDPHWIPPLVDTSGVVRDVHFGVDDNGSRSGNSQRSGGSSFPGWSLVLTVLYAFSFLGSVALLLLLLRLHRTMNLPKSALNRSSLMLTEFIFDAETEDPLYRYGLGTDGTSFGDALVQGGEEPSQDGLFCDLNFLNQSSSMQRIG